MKLAGWSLRVYRLPYAREVVWSNAIESSGLYALLELRTADGLAGVAEGTLKDTWSGVSPRSLAAALEDIVLPRLAGVDLGSEQAVADALAKLPENRLAKGMVDIACCTLRAAAAGTPLWKLWGGAPEVEVCWTVTRQPPADMARESADHCSRYGFRTLKVKGGQGIDTDLRALAEIRAAVGPEVALYVDANSAYAPAEAARYVQRIAEAGATVAEDPCTLVPDAAFQALQAASPIPILVDNSCTSLRDAAFYVERGAQAVALKPGRIGFTECRRIQQRLGPGRRTAIGIYAESALGTLLTLQLQAPMAAEQSFFLMMADSVSRCAPEIRNGRIRLPDEADLSKLVDERALERFAA